MKVYICIHGADHEGDQIFGVYAEEDNAITHVRIKAEAVRDSWYNLEELKPLPKGHRVGDMYIVYEEHEVL